jgi:methyltransferase (TIGR00027 family)
MPRVSSHAGPGRIGSATTRLFKRHPRHHPRTLASATFGWHGGNVRADEPSRTALGAASHRAVHQVVDHAVLFEDPLAVAIAGFADAADARDAAGADPASTRMRWFINARSRFADERVFRAVADGARQVVVLGAGLDTLAYRWSAPSGVRIFEVDHPVTQAWKRRRLVEIGIAVPDAVSYVPVDLQHADLAAALRVAGFRPAERSIVVWLGVLPYLSLDAVTGTLRALATLGQLDLVFDYGEPIETREGAARREYEKRASRVAALGEPWLTMLRPA